MKISNLPNQKKVALLVLAVAIILLALVLAMPYFPWNQKVSSYDECAKQGNPILDSYPSVCVSKDGQHFTNPNEHVAPSPQQ